MTAPTITCPTWCTRDHSAVDQNPDDHESGLATLPAGQGHLTTEIFSHGDNAPRLYIGASEAELTEAELGAHIDLLIRRRDAMRRPALAVTR